MSKICSNCKATNPDDAIFCPDCGDRLSTPSIDKESEDIDPLFASAARMVVISQRASTSDLQRRLGMGYARALKVLEQLEEAGIVGPQEGSIPRQALISDLDELERLLNR